MAAVIDPANRAFLTGQIQDLQAWASCSAGQFTVALLYGGVSAEDQFYIAKSPPEQLSVTALSGALTALGWRFSVLDPCRPEFIAELAGFDVALPNLHGPFGEDGRLQGLLDYLRTPYCGSGVAASAIAADKILCKQMMAALGIPTPAWRTWPGPTVTWPGCPVMVKPRTGGSSVGMSLARDQHDLPAALALAETGDPPGVLVEDYVPGLPVTVGLLELPGGVLVFPPLATRVNGAEFYDAAAKLGDGDGDGSTVWCGHAALPEPTLTAVTTHALTLWESLGCQGMARADFIVTGPGEVFALELNTIPGMSYGSNFITAAGLCGLRPADVVAAILHEALSRPRYDAPLPVPAFTARPDRKSPPC
jgi:D-alanine-D-alanine ligase